MKSWITTFAVVAALGTATSSFATTIIERSFTEVVNRAVVVVEGTVSDINSVTAGAPIPRSGETHDVPPALESTAGGAAAGSSQAPQALGVEGGEMIFTDVTLIVDDAIVGESFGQLSFRLAGGTVGDTTVTVHGMPQFEEGGRYVVFLRSNYEAVADPIVGVDQGFFPVVNDGTRDLVLDSGGDVVVAVVDDHVVTRFGGPAEALPAMDGPPVPDSEDVRVSSNSEIQRYRSSQEAMDLDDFKALIRATREGQK